MKRSAIIKNSTLSRLNRQLSFLRKQESGLSKVWIPHPVRQAQDRQVRNDSSLNQVRQNTGCDLISAFSLIELLVVISITSVMLGFLIPALNRSRELARQMVCQGRLRQWGLAFEAYSSVNDGFYPHIDGLDRNAHRADWFGWVDMLPPLMGQKPWREHRIYHRPGVDTIFQCPSARLARDGNFNYTPERVGFFSYAMNSCLELDGECWPPCYPNPDPITCGTNDMPSFLNTSLIRHPSRVILLFDQLLDPEYGYNAYHLNREAGRYCGAYPKDFSIRHRRSKQELGGFILFCDYHIEWQKSVWKGDWPDNLKVPPRCDVNWFPYPDF